MGLVSTTTLYRPVGPAELALILSRYSSQIVGARYHEEYWIPAEELEAFNDAIVGLIEVTHEFSKKDA